MGIKHKKNANKIKERKFCDLCIKLTWDMFRLTYFTRDPFPDSQHVPNVLDLDKIQTFFVRFD